MTNTVSGVHSAVRVGRHDAYGTSLTQQIKSGALLTRKPTDKNATNTSHLCGYECLNSDVSSLLACFTRLQYWHLDQRNHLWLNNYCYIRTLIIECFQVYFWLGHLRQHARVAHEDQRVQEAIRH